jgi:hypothetical protein
VGLYLKASRVVEQSNNSPQIASSTRHKVPPSDWLELRKASEWNEMSELISADLFEPVATWWDGPSLTFELVKVAEGSLGVKLPQSYIDVLAVRNGGYLHLNSYLAVTGSGVRRFSIPALMGIGGTHSIDSMRNGVCLSDFLLNQWHYPNLGVVICHFGHAGVVLDYSSSGPFGEPSVKFADVEGWGVLEVSSVANDFATLLSGLTVHPDIPPLSL